MPNSNVVFPLFLGMAIMAASCKGDNPASKTNSAFDCSKVKVSTWLTSATQVPQLEQLIGNVTVTDNEGEEILVKKFSTQSGGLHAPLTGGWTLGVGSALGSGTLTLAHGVGEIPTKVTLSPAQKQGIGEDSAEVYFFLADTSAVTVGATLNFSLKDVDITSVDSGTTCTIPIDFSWIWTYARPTCRGPWTPPPPATSACAGKAEGDRCEDGNPCTNDEKCHGGVCGGNWLTYCVPCRDAGDCCGGMPSYCVGPIGVTVELATTGVCGEDNRCQQTEIECAAGKTCSPGHGCQ